MHYCVGGVCNGQRSCVFFFFQAEDGIRDVERSRGLGDVYKRQANICGGPAGISTAQPFEKTKDIAKGKAYGVSAETFNTSWVDGGKVKRTLNYESAKFNIMNHGFGTPNSVTGLLRKNVDACNRVKSIAEYTDLTRVTAPKPNFGYQEVLQRNPDCFRKSSGFCAQHLDQRYSMGPFFKPF
eukprot:TRINITY_DN18056_c0_g1_i1.p1 TRINITY_DN18056_c0_g1~~TRINITY_DN18056_c0_g1_i1.p1  ORF type:complete len:182 (-),score=23.37 TRINITY_DN18056_c0_g1_i1:204-749(-)